MRERSLSRLHLDFRFCSACCRYTWKLYSERLMTLSGVYGFWKYVSNLDRRETKRYLEMFYALKYRNLVGYLHEIVLQTIVERFHGSGSLI
ncbi:hypothetical protein KSP40_PGU001546 [Platanthera guangdongensis]|uniref:sucrose synthase n=1 Tax=Platanthera guangdongensis TaxID=2320717 RepID=A0ABR2LUB4_9ASPA